jgi:hydrogenase nickel incorporation protein HypB
MTVETISVSRDLQSERRAAAEAWRQELTARGILCVNLISSPGAGKTSLLQATARHWSAGIPGSNPGPRMAVLVGDIATDRDAQRLAPLVPVRQLTTGGACHLELPLVKSGFQQLTSSELENAQFLFVENVGNLVCPASHDLGEHLRVVVLSVTEGDDKPGKYPKAFRTSDACVINKIDLLPYVPFSMGAVTADAHLVKGDLPVFPVSAFKGDGVAEWCQFLQQQRALRCCRP